ncbi:MAG: carboxypeptidase-like regulatory domain-containing protein, partial [Cytophagales bacterium]|nr:carboxypeptidase-like regulatory domain-containing protein [Cytophagales bacterium]
MKILYKTLILKMSKGLLHGIIIAIIFSSYLIAGNTHAQAPSIRHVKISLDLENTSLPKVFAAIEAKTAFIFSYEKNLIASRLDAITIKVKNQSVAAVLEKVAKETGLSFKQIKANIMVKVPPSMNRRAGQKSTIADRIIKGKITDENGEPLSGATILIKGTTIGAVADLEGSYTISLPDDATTLVFTFIGFVPQEISIGGRNVIDVVMVADLTTLDE